MSRTRSRALLALPASAALLALLVACSDDAAQTAPEVSTTQAPAGDQQADEMPGGGGTSGEIAAVSDLLMQVQGDDGQTAVSWDAGTTITQSVAGTLADVTVGSCVVTVGASGDDSTAAATSVTVTAATDGECSGGFGGGAGGGMPGGSGGGSGDGERPSGMPSGAPDGAMPEGGELPDGAPTGQPDGDGGGGGFGTVTAGLVTAVDGSTITVQQIGEDSSTTGTVTVDGSTTYTTTVTADSSAIAVGLCVTAIGEADSSGQVAATSLALSEAGDSGCSTGFGGGMPGGGRGGAGSGEGSGQGSDQGQEDADA